MCRDTAGQERYQTITKQYYRRAQVIPVNTGITFMCQFSIRSLILFVNSCSGYRLCLRHHKRAVLSAHSEVGQWCGWSRSISTLISLPSHWLSICTTAYWTVDAHCTPSGLVWVTRWVCLLFVSFFFFCFVHLFSCSMPQTRCKGSWLETSLMKSSADRWQRTKGARFARA